MEVTPQAVNGVCILITRCTRKDAFSILVADSSGNKARFSMCGCCGVESSIGHVCLIPTDGIFCCDKLVADSGKKSSGKKRAVFCSASSAVEIIADGVFISLLIRFGSIFSSQILFSMPASLYPIREDAVAAIFFNPSRHISLFPGSSRNSGQLMLTEAITRPS